MNSVVLTFTGDIAFDQYFSMPVREPLLDQSIAEFVTDSDYCIGNAEGPFIHLENAEAPQFKHHSDCSTAQIIRNYGINIWNLANNHALDFGREGISSSIDLAERLGCRTMGAWIGEEQAAGTIIIPGGGGVGLFSATYSERKMQGLADCSYLDWDDLKGIREAVAKIKKECRWCVMIVHGGEEFSDLPMPETRNRYLSYLHTGVDVVVGHHPHVVQNYETVGGKIVFYSLGNFIFDTDYQRNQTHTDVGELVKIRFYPDAFEWVSMPVRIDRENGRVIREKRDPVVFTDLRERKYRKLWRCAAKGYYSAERKVRIFLNPEKYRNYSALRWVKRDLSLLRAKRDLSRIAGRYSAWCSRVNREDSAIKEYVMHR